MLGLIEFPRCHTLGEHRLVLEWRCDYGGYSVAARPPEAAGSVFGWGKTVEDALANLEKRYQELLDFAGESDADWWQEMFLPPERRDLKEDQDA